MEIYPIDGTLKAESILLDWNDLRNVCRINLQAEDMHE
jgi:hypothetical protein